MARKPETKNITPPYVGISNLEKTLELISNRNSAEVSIDIFTVNGFNKTDALLALSALRFLGIIDEAGKTTDLAQKLRLRGDVRKQEYEKIVRTSYKKLFEARDNPQDLSYDDLTNEFFINYKLSPRVVRAAIPVFLKLCEFAGLKEAGSVVGRVRQPKVKTAEPTAINNSAIPAKKSSGNPFDDFPFGGFKEPRHSPNLSLITKVDGQFELYMQGYLRDNQLIDDKLNERLRNVVKELKAIADDYLPKEKSDPKESETK